MHAILSSTPEDSHPHDRDPSGDQHQSDHIPRAPLENVAKQQVLHDREDNLTEALPVALSSASHEETEKDKQTEGWTERKKKQIKDMVPIDQARSTAW